MLKKMLQGIGYEVQSFISCAEAIKAFQKNGADLLITDYSMPEMTGVELAEKLWIIQNNLPVILMTGYAEALSEEQSKKIGIKEFLFKPIVQQELTKAIRKVLFS